MMRVADKPISATDAVDDIMDYLFPDTIRWSRIVRLTAKEWARIENNPRQRDTERHARSSKHLLVPHATHARVNMAELPSGHLVKLDGHTRSYLWETGRAEPPKLILADVYSVPDMQAAQELYLTFDNRAAVETVGDEVFGAVRSLGLDFQSDLLKQFRFVAAIRQAYELMYGQSAARSITPTALVSHWRSELIMLDGINAPRARFVTGVLVGALLTLRRYGTRALPFWELYATGNGTKGDGRMDGVQALHERVMQRKADRDINGRQSVIDIASMVLSAFDAFRLGRSFVAGKAGVKKLGDRSLTAWLQKVKDASHQHED